MSTGCVIPGMDADRKRRIALASAILLDGSVVDEHVRTPEAVERLIDDGFPIDDFVDAVSLCRALKEARVAKRDQERRARAALERISWDLHCRAMKVCAPYFGYGQGFVFDVASEHEDVDRESKRVKIAYSARKWEEVDGAPGKLVHGFRVDLKYVAGMDEYGGVHYVVEGVYATGVQERTLAALQPAGVFHAFFKELHVAIGMPAALAELVRIVPRGGPLVAVDCMRPYAEQRIPIAQTPGATFAE